MLTRGPSLVESCNVWKLSLFGVLRECSRCGWDVANSEHKMLLVVNCKLLTIAQQSQPQQLMVIEYNLDCDIVTVCRASDAIMLSTPGVTVDIDGKQQRIFYYWVLWPFLSTLCSISQLMNREWLLVKWQWPCHVIAWLQCISKVWVSPSITS